MTEPAWTFTAIPLLDGWEGIDQSVRAMQDYIGAGLHDPRVRRVAEWILRPARDGDRMSEASVIYEFVRRHVQYRRDPAWMELLEDPRIMLARIERFGWAAEDCDGHSMLSALLGLQVRLPMALVLVGPDHRTPPVHVYAAMRESEDSRPSQAWLDGDDSAPSGLVSMDTARPGAAFDEHAAGFVRRVVSAVR